MAKHKKREFLKSLLSRFSYDEDDDTEVQYEPVVDQATKVYETHTNYTMYHTTEENLAAQSINTPAPTTIIDKIYNSLANDTRQFNIANGTTVEDRIIAETMSTGVPVGPGNINVQKMTFNNSIRKAITAKRKHFSIRNLQNRLYVFKERLQTVKIQWWGFVLMFLFLMSLLFFLTLLVKKFNEFRIEERLDALERKSKTCAVQVQNSETDSEMPKKSLGNQPVNAAKNAQSGISFVFSKDENKKADAAGNNKTSKNSENTRSPTGTITSTATTENKGAVITRKFNADAKPGSLVVPLNLEKTTIIKYGAVEINYNLRKHDNGFQKMPTKKPTDDDLESSTESEESHTHMDKHLVPKKEHHALNVPGSTDAGPHNIHPTPRHDKTEEHLENEVANVRFVEYTHIQNKIHGNMNKLVIRDDSENTVHFEDIAIAERAADIEKPSSSTTTKATDDVKHAQSLKSLLSERCESAVSQNMRHDNRIIDEHFKTFMENIEDAGVAAKVPVKEYIEKIEVIESDLDLEKAPELLDLENMKNIKDDSVKKCKEVKKPASQPLIITDLENTDESNNINEVQQVPPED